MKMDNVWWAISHPVDKTAEFLAPIVEQSDFGEQYPMVKRSSRSLRQSSLEQGTTSVQVPDEFYLDSQKRYRLLGESSRSDSFCCRVTDLQPCQKTRLEEQLDALEEQLDHNADCFQELPQSALPYLNLQEVAAIPEIRDAWREETREVILVSDRSQWLLLTDSIMQLSVPQACCYLDQMVQLWQTLADENCCQSLLVPSNLRLNAEGIALQQLFLDPSDRLLTLAELAQTWQPLLERAGKTAEDLLAQAAQGVESQLQAQSVSIQSSSASAHSVDDSQDDMPTVVLPMELRSLSDAGATDIGRQRESNEDYFGIETSSKKQESGNGKTVEARGLYIVCDGMGGHIDGELASKMAAETLQHYFQTHWHEEFPSAQTITDGILLANQTIHRVNQENRRTGNQRMGTTLAMALVQNTQIAIATVGDSRIYRITRHGIEQLSLDHTVGQHEVLRGVEPETAYSRLDAYQLTQALGPSDNNVLSPHLQFFKTTEDTLLLLCSDGLSDNELIENADEYLFPLLSSKASLEQGLHKLIGFANQHNGHDNLTGILVRVKVQPKLEPKPNPC